MNRKNLLWELWLLSVLTIGLGACQSDEIVISAVTESEEAYMAEITLTCVMGNGVESRAMIDLDNEDAEAGELFYWNSGDVIWVKNLGSEGSDSNGSVYKFEIADDYIDGSSNTATFTCTEIYIEGDSGSYLHEGDVICAVFLGSQEYDTSWGNTLEMLLDEFTVEMTSNSDEEINKYLHDNMRMYAKTTFSQEGTTLDFSQLTTLLRITYYNETDAEQTISSVDYPGNNFERGWYFYLEDGSFNTNNGANWFTQTFEGLTVAANESIDFYGSILCASEASAATSYTIKINDESVVMKSSDVGDMLPGYRYWFKVSMTDDGLAWTNYVLTFDSYTTLYVSDSSEELCNALANQVFGAYLDDDGNVVMPTEVVEATTELTLGLESYKGLEIFSNLEILYCWGYGDAITSLDVSNLTNIKQLHCWGNSLTELDVSYNTALEYLGCDQTYITSLDLSNNTELTYVDVSDNLMTEFNLGEISAITQLQCESNRLSELDIRYLSNLSYLKCGNQIDADGNNIELTLYLTESQNEKWESSWQSYDDNVNVVVSIVDAE